MSAPQSATAKENFTIPSKDDIAKAGELVVYDDDGKERTFSSLIADQKTIVVFIRHFFCGSCQRYVTQLGEVPPSLLENAGVKLIVVGCGEHQLIPNYRKNTNGFAGFTYANPNRALYDQFDMVSNLDMTPKGQQPRSYAHPSYIGNVVNSIIGVRNPLHIGKQGKVSQNGGEFVFGPGNTCSFARRMVHTEDHMEVADLLKEAGITYTR